MALLRWLAIILVALSMFMMVILAVGYILKTNEQRTGKLVEQLAEEEKAKISAESPKVTVVITNEQQSLSAGAMTARMKMRQQSIITEHLTCFKEQQCEVVLLPIVDSYSASCFIAINNIGAKLLVKLSEQESLPISNYCLDEKPTDYTAQCLQNLCQIQ